MGQITLVSKTDAGAGNFTYTYDCVCIPKPVKQIVVGPYGNDNEAQQDAQAQCDAYCSQSNE